MTNTAQAVGVVSSVSGEVFARASNGELRRLVQGDRIFEGEVVITANGSHAEINMFDGPVLHVAEQQTVAVDQQVSNLIMDDTVGAVQPLGSTDASKVIQTVQTGSVLDVNALIEQDAPAAGLTAGDTAEGGHTFVDLLRIVEAVPAVAYEFPTNPAGSAPLIAGQTAAPADEAPPAPTINASPWVAALAATPPTEGTAKAGDVVFTYNGGDPDTPADQLTYTLTGNNGGLLALGQGNTIVLTEAGASAVNANTPPATLSAQITVSDGNSSASDNASTQVNPVNDPPVVHVVAAENLTEGSATVGMTVFTYTGSDPDSTNLTYTLTNTSGGYLALGTDGKSIVLTEEGVKAVNADTPIGSLTAQVTVSDGSLSASDDASLNVTPVNDPPTVDVFAVEEGLTEGRAEAGMVVFTYRGTDPDTPADQLHYTLTNDNNGLLEFGEGNTIVLTAAGAEAVNADVPIESLFAEVTVSDGNSEGIGNNTALVTAVDDGPSVEVVIENELTEGDAEAGMVVFTYSGTDPDTPADQLHYTLTNDNNGLLEFGEGNTIVLTAAGAEAVNADVPIESLFAEVTVSDGNSEGIGNNTALVTAVYDPPEIIGLNVEGSEGVVYENALSFGSTPNSPFETTRGSFTVKAPEGLADLTVGGASIMHGGAFTTSLGNKMTFSLVQPENSDELRVNFTYTLLDNENHSLGSGDLIESFKVVVTDTDRDFPEQVPVTSTLDISIVDDVPSFTMTTGTIGSIEVDHGRTSGTLGFTGGADEIDAIGVGVLDGSQLPEGFKYTLNIEKDGDWTFKLLSDIPNTPVHGGIEDWGSGKPVDQITTECPLSTSDGALTGESASVTVTGYDVDNHQVKINPSDDLGVGNNVINTGEHLHFAINGSPSPVNSVEVTLAQFGGAKGASEENEGKEGKEKEGCEESSHADKVQITYIYSDGTTVNVTHEATQTGQGKDVSYDYNAIPEHGGIVGFEVEAISGNGFKVAAIGFETTLVDPLQLSFDVAIKDGDGDVAVMQNAITVNIGDVLDSPTHEFNIGSNGLATPVLGTDTTYLASTNTTDQLIPNSTLTAISNG